MNSNNAHNFNQYAFQLHGRISHIILPNNNSNSLQNQYIVPSQQLRFTFTYN